MVNSLQDGICAKKINGKISSIQFTKIKEYAKNHPSQFWQPTLKNLE
jgi:hypothetical protein